MDCTRLPASYYPELDIDGAQSEVFCKSNTLSVPMTSDYVWEFVRRGRRRRRSFNV